MLLLSGFYLGLFVWGRKPILKKKILEPRSVEKNFSGLLRVSGGMLPQKILKDSVQDWLKSHFWTLVTFNDSLKSSCNQHSI